MSTGSKTIAELPEVQILDDKDQFLFFQNSTKKTKRITKGNMAISGGGLRGKFIDAATGNDVGLSSATALANAEIALSTANGAQGSANGKNKIFYQNLAPDNPINGYTLVINDLWFDTDGGHRMAKWSGSVWVDFGLETQAIANIDAGKITSGFISSQVIELANSTAYFQSSRFIETWTATRSFTNYNSRTNGKKANVSDQDFCKVLQSDGTYKIFKSIGQSNINQQPPGSGVNSSYWDEVTATTNPALNSIAPLITVALSPTQNSTFRDLGFRIVGSGVAEFGSSIFRGVIVSQEGFFGSSENAARIDATGLTIGSNGRIMSAGVTHDTASPGVFGGDPGFFLGYTGGKYQFYVGNASTNYLRWNGTNLSVKGEIKATSGFFGSADTAVSVGNLGLSVGTTGRITSGLEWSSSEPGNFTRSSSGFFLGYASSQYRFFIGSTADLSTGSGNYLYWDGTTLKIGGNVVGGTTVGAANDQGAGLTINSPYGIRQGNTSNAAILTITGGNANGIQAGAQIDLCGSAYSNAGGMLILQAGSGDLSEIRLSTNTFNNQAAAQVGVIRAAVKNTGLFEIQRNPGSRVNGAQGTQFNVNAGNLYVYSNVGIGMAPAETNTTGLIDENVTGKLYVSNQVILYSSNVAKLTLTASNGNVSSAGGVSAVSFTTSSSKKVKTNIKKLNSGLEIIDKLRPVSFKRKDTKQEDIGLIAEEVDKILPVIVKHNDKNEAEGLDYSKLTVILINAVKELSAEVKELKKKLKDANTN